MESKQLINDAQVSERGWYVDAVQAAPPQYESPLREWATRAWVHNGEYRRGPFCGEFQFYSPHRTGYFTHPAIQAAPESAQRAILAHHIVRELEKTVWIENELVVPTSVRATRGELLPLSCEASRHDAGSLASDEAAHSLFTREMQGSICEEAGIEPLSVPLPISGALSFACAGRAPESRALVVFGWTTGIETLISGDLAGTSDVDGIYPQVAAMLADHSKDEAFHASLFRRWFTYAWPSLKPSARMVFIDGIAQSLAQYSALDVVWLGQVLRECGVTIDPVAVAEEIASWSLWSERVRAAAAPTIRMLRTSGVFEDPRVLRQFRQQQLVTPG